jgi:membrane-associated phospholipid phosphatase
MHRQGLRSYGLGWLPGLLAMLGLWLACGYRGSFLQVNGWRHAWLDALMPHFTHLGDGLILFALAGLVLLWRREAALWLTLVGVMLSVLLVVFGLKNLVFSGWTRPALVFEGDTQAFYQISTRALTRFSFPSGHATASAAAWLLPALALGRHGWACAVLGGLLAYSRVYIGVHFLGDILAGSLLGLGLAVGIYGVIFPHLATWWGQKTTKRQAQGQWLLLGLTLGLLLVAVVSVYGRYYG